MGKGGIFGLWGSATGGISSLFTGIPILIMCGIGATIIIGGMMVYNLTKDPAATAVLVKEGGELAKTVGPMMI